MSQITALNELRKDDDLEDLTSSIENQESIVESEYIRAIKLKNLGKSEISLQLFNELLQTKVLCEILDHEKNKKLRKIRYNCYKNIAFIYEENHENELALNNYIWAIKLDDSDVYTLNRFAQLSLKSNALELAQFGFELCLKENPNYLGAACGILQTLHRTHNIFGICQWAAKLMKQKCCSNVATLSLRKVASKFTDLMPLFGEICNEVFENSLQTSLDPQQDKKSYQQDEIPLAKENTNTLITDICPDLNAYCLKEPDWQTLGNFLEITYKSLSEQQSLFIKLSAGNLFLPTTIVRNNENLESNIGQVTDLCNKNNNNLKTAKDSEDSFLAEENSSFMITNEDDDARAVLDTHKKLKSGESIECNKPKFKRRCSDLSSLEQWGWHKTRKYARKKSLQDRTEVEASLSTTLWKLFRTYITPKDDNPWPFHDSFTNTNFNTGLKVCSDCDQLLSVKEFGSQTKIEFEIIMKNLKKETFDILLYIFKWLKQIAFFWNKRLPAELSSIYLNVFEIYVENFELSNCNQLDSENFKASYRICLLYLELASYKYSLSDSCEYSNQWLVVFDHLLYNYGNAFVAFAEEFEEHKLRLLVLKSMRSYNQNQMEESINALKLISKMLDKQKSTYIFHLPNSPNSCLSKNWIQQQISHIQRQISLRNVPRLFENKKWTELIMVITENISSDKDNHACENWSKDFKIQCEILLQSFWSNGLLEECLKWSEKFLHYFTNLYVSNINSFTRQKEYTASINYVISYIKKIVDNKDFPIASISYETLERLTHNIIRILSIILDVPYSKSFEFRCDIHLNILWIILHKIMQRDGRCEYSMQVMVNDMLDEESLLPPAFVLLFTSHSFLGKRQLCTKDNGEILFYILDEVTPNIKAPIYDNCRDIINEYIEQITHCLYGFPAKKGRSRHLEDHEAIQMDLTWSRAILIYDFYKPLNLPELNSYKVESITSDMEQFFLRIINLIPQDDDPTSETEAISNFISGDVEKLPTTEHKKLPYKIRTIYYLLADFYFKNRDFSKAIKYYILDITINLDRYDSWAGLALSKASQIETKINGFSHLSLSTLITESNAAIKCFDRGVFLNKKLTLLWIEYGSFTYMLHSYFSRYLKQTSNKQLNQEIMMAKEYKEKMLTISLDCFEYASNLQSKYVYIQEDSDDMHEEKWLCKYMLGKIAEKRKRSPSIFLNYYLTAANFLYESKATYPIKINHNNPTTLSVEALEVFYRINASMMKYLEQQEKLTREHGDLFKNVIENLATSPFAFNKAKIDGNCLAIGKRKLELANDETSISKRSCHSKEVFTAKLSEDKSCEKPKMGNYCSSRRESLESSITGTTWIASGSTSTANSDSSQDTETDSNTSKENEIKKSKDNAFYNALELKSIYKALICNLEECATRFPEHYKSIFRLVHFYMCKYAKVSDLDKCVQLMFGNYKTGLGNQINGLFFERKNNNLFNGIWRLPSPEVDRPGSFSAHLVKCVDLLLKLLLKTGNYQMLNEISLLLFKTPDNDKRYIIDEERVELSQQSIKLCAEAIENQLKKYVGKKDNNAILELLLDIYKIYKKCLKYYNNKQPIFSNLMLQAYKHYIGGTTEENHVTCDHAIKYCLQVMNYRKYCEKNQKTKSDESSSSMILQAMAVNLLSQQAVITTNKQENRFDTSNENLLSSIFDHNINVNFENILKEIPNEILPSANEFGTDVFNIPEAEPLASFTSPNLVTQTNNRNESFELSANNSHSYFSMQNMPPSVPLTRISNVTPISSNIAVSLEFTSKNSTNSHQTVLESQLKLQSQTGQGKPAVMLSDTSNYSRTIPIFNTFQATNPLFPANLKDNTDIPNPTQCVSSSLEVSSISHQNLCNNQCTLTKTLQQKLIERQNANKQNIDDDIIILD